MPKMKIKKNDTVWKTIFVDYACRTSAIYDGTGLRKYPS